MSTNSPSQQARLIMEAVSVLHERGYGRLKLYAYLKDGLGAWRHALFAADSYPEGLRGLNDLPRPAEGGGSLPGDARARGASPEKVADALERKYPRLRAAAKGADDAHVAWYCEMLQRNPGRVFELESPDMLRLC